MDSCRHDGGRIYVRLLGTGDAAQLLRFKLENREYLRPFSPEQDPADDSLERQRALLEGLERSALADRTYGFGVFTHPDDLLVGRVNLNNVVRGAFHNAYLGYSMAEAFAGRGLMTEAVGLVTEAAFRDISLHRLQAAIMPHNIGSIRVVERNRYRREGFARRYLRIGGDWRDHILYARLCDE